MHRYEYRVNECKLNVLAIALTADSERLVKMHRMICYPSATNLDSYRSQMQSSRLSNRRLLSGRSRYF